MKPLKVALCFSGQLRTWKQTIEDNRFFFQLNSNPDITIDCFAHTWDYNTWIDTKYENVLNGPKYINSYTEPVNKFELEEFKETYNLKSFVVDSVIKTYFNEWEHPLYSFMRSMEIKRQYELDNNFDYDLVIKTRADSIWPGQKFNYKKPSPLSITAGLRGVKMPIEFFLNDLNDVLFWGDSFSMDLLGNAYRWNFKNTTDKIKNQAYLISQVANRKLGPGTIFHKYASELGLFVYYEENPWKIVRKTQ